MKNTLPASEVKRRGMAAIEERLQQGPVHIIKRNKAAAVVLSEEEYHRLTSSQSPAQPGMTALEWLLSQPATGTREKADIDAALAEARDW